jgi:hypothetical protein
LYIERNHAVKIYVSQIVGTENIRKEKAPSGDGKGKRGGGEGRRRGENGPTNPPPSLSPAFREEPGGGGDNREGAQKRILNLQDTVYVVI